MCLEVNMMMVMLKEASNNSCDKGCISMQATHKLQHEVCMQAM
jgi:hypothetical protein